MSRKLEEIELDENNSKKLKSQETQDEDDEILNEEEAEVIGSNEALYGIKQRINKDYKLFGGILKQSPADFIVNEVDLSGKVVKLTNFDIPVSENKQYKDQNPEELEKKRNAVKDILDSDLFEKMIEFISSEKIDETFKIDAPKDKTERKMIHDFIKLYSDKFFTNTIQKDKETQSIEISHVKSNKKTSNRDSFKANPRSKDLGDKKFTICSVYKENIDTIQAVNLIAKHLRLNIKRIGYSGTKDKKAKTTQLLSFFKIDPKEIVRLNNNFHNIKLGNFKVSDEGLKLGDLSGNRFKLVLREITETNDEYIRQGLESLKNRGFINYFGLQRFGNCVEIPTHMIGKHLILNDIKEAIDLILKPRNQDFEKNEIKKAREVWNTTSDPNRALFHIQRINCIEKFLLNGLAKSAKNDHLGAFQFIPRNMRLMYLHAYQSYIWNEAVSKRIEDYGLRAVVGDLVRKKDSSLNEVLILNEENISEYSIEDIVLPLPGHSILYPENKIKNFYSEILQKDGLTFESFKNKIKDFSLGGDYRNILVRPKDMEYEIINYFDKSQKLTQSDWDLLNPECRMDEPKVEEKQMKAICVEYTLQTSSYATMALREILIESK